MAVTSVNVLQSVGGFNKDFSRSYTVTYRVITNSASDGPAVVCTAAGLPRKYTPYIIGNDIDTGVYCESVTARHEDWNASRLIWLVTVQYGSSSKKEHDDNEQQGSPLDTRAKWSGGHAQFQIVASQDKDGDAVKNSANQQYDPLPMKDNSRPVINVVKNVANLDLNTWASYIDAVNDGTWWGLATRKLKCQSIQWQQMFHGSGTPYYQVTYEFHVKDDLWDYVILDAGYEHLINGGADTDSIKDDNNVETSIPWPLNGSGVALTTAQKKTDSNYFWYKPGTTAGWRIYAEKDFSALGLPTVIGAPY